MDIKSCPCENAAVKRWLNRNHQNKHGYTVTLLGDDLYSHQPICELALKPGYNLEHNFGHGENHLCELLLSLNLLAFLFHTVLDLVNYTYQKVRELLVTRTSFFNDMRTLLKFIWFKDWSDFFSFIFREYVPFKKANSS
jgi:hypothetical protein